MAKTNKPLKKLLLLKMNLTKTQKQNGDFQTRIFNFAITRDLTARKH